MTTAPDLPAHGVQGAERWGWQHELLVVLVVIFQREFHFVERMFQKHFAMVNLCKRKQRVGTTMAAEKTIDRSALLKQSFVDDLKFGLLFIGYPHYRLPNWFRPVSCPTAIIYNCTEPQHLNHGFTDGAGEG